MCIWNARWTCVLLKNCGSHALFTKLASTKFNKKKTFKTGSHGIIHTFKNYFATVFSIFSNKRYPSRLLNNFLSIGRWIILVMYSTFRQIFSNKIYSMILFFLHLHSKVAYVEAAMGSWMYRYLKLLLLDWFNDVLLDLMNASLLDIWNN